MRLFFIGQNLFIESTAPPKILEINILVVNKKITNSTFHSCTFADVDAKRQLLDMGTPSYIPLHITSTGQFWDQLLLRTKGQRPISNVGPIKWV